jgi:hypothetical protein
VNWLLDTKGETTVSQMVIEQSSAGKGEHTPSDNKPNCRVRLDHNAKDSKVVWVLIVRDDEHADESDVSYFQVSSRCCESDG